MIWGKLALQSPIWLVLLSNGRTDASMILPLTRIVRFLTGLQLPFSMAIRSLFRLNSRRGLGLHYNHGVKQRSGPLSSFVVTWPGLGAFQIAEDWNRENL
ncbi:hypothetical protein GALMADRAFT_761340 [Galerina marginata CBS 339.88]|uniref:Secreted protein n=1 Tax=Galerina marginata (strain CBS 339.88) TaxID=685588 RepID=A0A067SP18_GALM3|nr:hypothetical protein GALMADRAFT_761340 [Galerina marginata CBS 339.88]